MRRVLCFGDSITFGRGEMPAKGWCGRLKDKVESLDEFNAVYNLGIPGHTSTGLLQRLAIESKARIRSHRADNIWLMLIAIGTNDCKIDAPDTERTPLSQFKENIHDLIRQAKELGAKFAFIGLPPVDEKETNPYEDTIFTNERVKLYNDAIKEYCASQNVLFLDMFSEMSKLNYTSLLEDGLHPNSAGYDAIFGLIWKFLEEHNLLK